MSPQFFDLHSFYHIFPGLKQLSDLPPSLTSQDGDDDLREGEVRALCPPQQARGPEERFPPLGAATVASAQDGRANERGHHRDQEGKMRNLHPLKKKRNIVKSRYNRGRE